MHHNFATALAELRAREVSAYTALQTAKTGAKDLDAASTPTQTEDDELVRNRYHN
jgi:hypothetical protein